MAKPETTFTASVHRHLPPLSELYREKMANPYRGGTPDYWYSGQLDLWVEWKFIKAPKLGTTMIDLCRTLSALQQKWLADRSREGRNVWVIVGCAQGGVVFQQGGWNAPLQASEFKARLVERKELARAITNFVAQQ